MTSTALAGFKAGVFITSSPSQNTSTVAFTDSGDHKTWNIATASKQCLDDAGSFTVQKSTDGGSTWTTVTSGFVINYPIGQIVFASAITGTPAVQITAGKYFPFAFLAGAKEWDGTPSGTALETTVFTNPATPDKTFIGGVASATVKLMQLWLDPGMIGFLVPGVRVVLLLHTGANSNNRFQGYVIMSKTDIKSAVAAVNTEDTDWTVTGQFFYIAS